MMDNIAFKVAADLLLTVRVSLVHALVAISPLRHRPDSGTGPDRYYFPCYFLCFFARLALADFLIMKLDSVRISFTPDFDSCARRSSREVKLDGVPTDKK